MIKKKLETRLLPAQLTEKVQKLERCASKKSSSLNYYLVRITAVPPTTWEKWKNLN